MADPLPDLGPRDLRRCRVLHQVENRRGSVPAEPRLDVLEADTHIVPQARLRNRAARHPDVEEILCGDGDLFPQARHVVRPRPEDAIKHLHRDRDEVGVRDPRAVETIVRLSDLVLADLRDCNLVHFRVLAAWDESGHASDRVGSTEVTRADKEPRVGPHEWDNHRHLRSVGQDAFRAISELLDDREDVVPTARVQSDDMLPEFVQDLIYLERRWDRLDQDGRLDRASRQTQRLLGSQEDDIPEAGFEVTLELRQIEVRARAAREKFLRVVEEEQAEVRQAGGYGMAIDPQVLLLEVPSSRSYEEGRDPVLQTMCGRPARRRRSSDEPRRRGSRDPRRRSTRS